MLCARRSDQKTETMRGAGQGLRAPSEAGAGHGVPVTRVEGGGSSAGGGHGRGLTLIELLRVELADDRHPQMSLYSRVAHRRKSEHAWHRRSLGLSVSSSLGQPTRSTSPPRPEARGQHDPAASFRQMARGLHGHVRAWWREPERALMGS